MATEAPEQLREFVGRNGWYVSKVPTWHAWQVFHLFTTSVHMHLWPNPDDTTSDDGWRLEVIDNQGKAVIPPTQLNDRSTTVRRASMVLDQLNTVMELRNIHKEAQIREALETLGHWAVQLARRDLGLPRDGFGRQISGSYDEIVNRILNPPRA